MATVRKVNVGLSFNFVDFSIVKAAGMNTTIFATVFQGLIGC